MFKVGDKVKVNPNNSIDIFRELGNKLIHSAFVYDVLNVHMKTEGDFITLKNQWGDIHELLAGWFVLSDEEQSGKHIFRIPKDYKIIHFGEPSIKITSKIDEMKIDHSNCKHNYVPYVGLKDAYKFCTSCDDKKPFHDSN